MNYLLVCFVILGQCLDHGQCSDSSSSEDVSIDTPEVAALKEQLFFFLDGAEGFIDDTESRFLDSGEYFTDDGIWCIPAIGCAKSLEEMQIVFGLFPAIVEKIEFKNLKITGINPSLAIPSVTYITDELVTVASTGCSFLLPSLTGILYFDQDVELVSQYHLVDSDEQSVFALVDGLAPNATSCR